VLEVPWRSEREHGMGADLDEEAISIGEQRLQGLRKSNRFPEVPYQ
jgi:hypothetical protein